MKIIFVLTNIRISGGTRAIFEFADHLHQRKHDVCIVHSVLPLNFRKRWGVLADLVIWFLEAIGYFKQIENPDWFNLKTKLKRTPTLEEKYIPDADVVVATWWETAYFVADYSACKGKKFYLAQHYEIWGGPEQAVDQSYRLGLHVIVNSTWLKNILQDKLHVQPAALILHAPDFEQFYLEKARPHHDGIRVLMPYRDIPWKGIPDGIEAFGIARDRFPDIKLVMFGPELGENIPEYAQFHLRPANDALRGLYNSADVFLFPSRCEGYGMPPLEAMACGCAVVTTNVGGVPDYAVAGETALVSPPNDPQALAVNLLALIENEPLRKKIAQAGHDHIVSKFSWARSTDELEKLFKE